MPKITSNDYALELYQGPVIAATRVSGLAGATAADADAVEGVYNSAASPAVRQPFSLRWFDYDVSAGIAFPGAWAHTDFNNRGQTGDPRLIESTDRFLQVNLGGQVQLGQLGVTVMGDFLNYEVGGSAGRSVSLTLGRMHAVGAYGLLNNQLVIGAGARIATVAMAEQNVPDGASITMLGASPQVGAILKPDNLPWRLGFTARAPVEARALPTGRSVVDEHGVLHAGDSIVPSRITQPWELEAGVALQLGPRPLNPAWIDPHEQEAELEARLARDRAFRRAALRIARARAAVAVGGAAFPNADHAEKGGAPGTPEEREVAARLERLVREEVATRANEDVELAEAKRRLYDVRKARYLNWPREHVLLLASVLVTGASDQAVALEGFIDQRRELVGQHLSLSPRVAAESEPLPNILRLRAGVYIEPSRFEDGTARQHFTFGSDLRLFSWNVFGLVADTTWRLSAFLDVAPRFQNFGFALGAWH